MSRQTWSIATWSASLGRVTGFAWLRGTLTPRIDFTVTNLDWRPAEVTDFCDKWVAAQEWLERRSHWAPWSRMFLDRVGLEHGRALLSVPQSAQWMDPEQTREGQKT